MAGAERTLYCHCAFAQVVPDAVRRRVLGRLVASGEPFVAVPDLCALAARRDPRLLEIAAGGSATIAACRPRAVRWLFAAAGAPLPAEGVEILDMRAEDAAAGDAPSDAAAADALAADLEARDPDAWIPWFPVIDRDRCTDCGQCLDFCLFGVFERTEDGTVTVARPENCKTNCPACARVCPSVAIIFPKYEGAPIDGAEVGEDAPEPVRVDLASLLQGDVYAALRRRGGALEGAPMSGELDAALAEIERRRCACRCQGGKPRGRSEDSPERGGCGCSSNSPDAC
ncbi:MAG: ferredoxin family protein [Planctomycetes bacterium]|nr:ferredoxin family protein [Planctomycetota bacterium]